MCVKYQNVVGDMDNNVLKVLLRYVDAGGVPVTKYGSLVNGEVKFTGLGVTVPKDGTTKVEVLVDVNPAVIATQGEKIALDLVSFEANGVSSGNAVIGGKTGTASPNLMHVHSTRPYLLSNVSSPSGSRSVSATDAAFVFNVKVHKQDQVNIKKILIDMYSDADFSMASTSGMLKSGSALLATAQVKYTNNSVAEIEFTDINVEIPKDGTKALTLELDTGTLLDEDTGSDDPLTFSINKGSSAQGVVNPGGLWWEGASIFDTVMVKWLGNSDSYKFTSPTLKY